MATSAASSSQPGSAASSEGSAASSEGQAEEPVEEEFSLDDIMAEEVTQD